MSAEVRKQLKDLPAQPGVYLFKNKAGQVLYVGKAGNLKKRARSYFLGSYAPANPAKAHLIKEIADLEARPTQGEIEALVLESRLIKELRPRYNKLMRDDKQYFFVQITDDEFPRIFLTHRPAADFVRPAGSQRASRGELPEVEKTIRRRASAWHLGPFTSGRALKTTLKSLRKIFPYCTCKKPHRRRCLNAHLGLCPGYCCQQATGSELRITNNELRKEYLDNIKNIMGILKGEQKEVLDQLKQELKKASKAQAYEKAADRRDKIKALKKVLAHKRVLVPSFSSFGFSRGRVEAGVEYELAKLLNRADINLNRIEGYDISNIQGRQATGSLVVFVPRLGASGGWGPVKAEYRKFKIRAKASPDDPAMMQEVVFRRLQHPEWGWPDLILVDGGKGQLGAAIKAISERRSAIRQDRQEAKINRSQITNYRSPAVVALAKQQELLYTKNTSPLALNTLSEGLANLLRSIRDEAHRFAHQYHSKRRELELSHTRHTGSKPAQ